MNTNLSKIKKALLWELIEKYDKVYPELADSLSNCILKRETQEDLLLISSYIDVEMIDEEDFYKIESSVGPKIDILMFNI